MRYFFISVYGSNVKAARCGSWLNNLPYVVFVNRNGFVVEDLSQEISVFIYTLFLTMVSRGCCVFLTKTNLSLPLN